jgi:hypothetical protein
VIKEYKYNNVPGGRERITSIVIKLVRIYNRYRE